MSTSTDTSIDLSWTSPVKDPDVMATERLINDFLVGLFLQAEAEAPIHDMGSENEKE